MVNTGLVVWACFLCDSGHDGRKLWASYRCMAGQGCDGRMDDGLVKPRLSGYRGICTRLGSLVMYCRHAMTAYLIDALYMFGHMVVSDTGFGGIHYDHAILSLYYYTISQL